MPEARNRKHVCFNHLGLPIKFVLNTESPVTALFVKVGSKEEYLDANEVYQLFDLLLRNAPVIERLQRGVPVNLKLKLAREAHT